MYIIVVIYSFLWQDNNLALAIYLQKARFILGFTFFLDLHIFCLLGFQ